jgi:putative transposase
MNRGNRKALIFEDDRDRRRFLHILLEEKERHHVKVLAGCLMGNHFHLVVVTPEGNLSGFMDLLQGRFARYSNWRHERTGHLFQGRFRDVFIEHDIHLLTALCYVFTNPGSAGLVRKLEEHKWSTYAASAGYAAPPSYLDLEWLEALFPAGSLEESQRQLRQVMSEAKPVAAYVGQDEWSVSPDSIKRMIRSYVGGQSLLASVPGTYRAALRPTLEELFREGATDRAAAIHRAQVMHGYKLAEIARVLRLHPASVSRILCSFRRSR